MKGLAARFVERFGGRPRIVRAPGRVNLIGEHTDYNDGFVMPVAIDRATWVAVAPRQDRRLIAHSETVDDTDEASLDALRPRGRWSDYAFGVAAELERAGIRLSGATLLIASKIPLGAGLSSSASLEVAVAYALIDSAGARLDRLAIARLCQRAENDFVGARCGIMDQFTATHGQRGHALRLDCRSLDCTAVPLPAGVRLVICNTMVKHSVAAGEYNARRAECEAAARTLAAHRPQVRALRDVSLADLVEHRAALGDVAFRRARHVVSENARVLDAEAALARGDLDALGALMAASHRSLAEDFEVSCRELDAMVALARACDGVHGARMTGGGFGGCTINLVDERRVDTFAACVRTAYHRQTGRSPEIYTCSAAPGASFVDAA